MIRATTFMALVLLFSSNAWCEAEALLVCVDAQGASTPMTEAFRNEVRAVEGGSSLEPAFS